MPRRCAIVLGVAIAIAVGGCASGGTGPTGASPTSLAATPAPTATLLAPTSAPTEAPQPTKPVAWPRPRDLPLDGACEGQYSCLGLLKPGTVYHTSVFEPVLAFSVPSADWENLADEGGTFHLASMSAPGDEVLFFREPQALDPGVGRSVAELAAWLAGNPRLRVTTAQAVEVGGLSGVTLDIRIAPGAASDEFGCQVQVCVDLFKGVDPDKNDPYFWRWSWGAAGPEIQRLYLLTWPDGVLAVVVDSIDGTTFEELIKAWDEIRPTLKFG